jgi:Fic family protein
MTTLRRFLAAPPNVPMPAVWMLSDLAEGKGRQDLFTRQSPQRLETLRRNAIVESAISSNRIEGVEIEPARVRPVVLGRGALRDRNEEEVHGYRKALDWIHRSAAKIEISEKTILRLHELSRGGEGDAGQYRKRDLDIIETAANGRSRVRFRAVPAKQLKNGMKGLIGDWRSVEEDRTVPSLIALAAFNLDFLCLHPFRDGNGRVSRLLLLLQCYQAGLEVGRFVSIERVIEEHKERYYETLEESSRRWHEGKHDYWPYINYVLFVLKQAYRQFEQRLAETTAPRGEKRATVTRAIERAHGDFTVAEIQRECPGVSLDMIRHVLKELRAQGAIESLGRGRAARWRRTNGN